MGCRVIVQRGAGSGSGHTDEEYRRAGAEQADAPEALYAQADLLWKVKEILPAEYNLIRREHLIFTYLHAVPRPEMTRRASPSVRMPPASMARAISIVSVLAGE